MMAALRLRLALLTARERWLLGVLVAVVLPVALVAGVLLPLLDARTAARQAAAEARADLDWIAAQVAGLPAGGLAPAAAAVAPVGLAELERGIVAAGLREGLGILSNRAGGGVDLGFEDVAFDPLARWMAGVERTAGYRIAVMQVERLAPGRVRALFQLEPAG